MLKFTVSTLNLHKILQVLFLFFNELKLQRICYRVIWNMSTKKTGDRMNKSINLNPVGNIESFGSPINSIFSFEIVEGSDKLLTFVFTLAFSTTTGFEVIFPHYWDFLSFWNTFFCSFDYYSVQNYLEL